MEITALSIVNKVSEHGILQETPFQSIEELVDQYQLVNEQYSERIQYLLNTVSTLPTSRLNPFAPFIYSQFLTFDGDNGYSHYFNKFDFSFTNQTFLYDFEFRLDSVTRHQMVIVYGIKDLVTQFFAFALGVIGLCKIVGELFNYELLMSKYIQCLYYLSEQDND